MKNTRWFAGAFVRVLLCSAFIAGCSATDGYIGHSIVTEVQLHQANYTIVKSVTGTATADYFFGIGPAEQDLMGQAKRDMLNKAQLRGSQAVINVTTDSKLTIFALIWREQTAYVSADVIEFK